MVRDGGVSIVLSGCWERVNADDEIYGGVKVAANLGR